MAISKRLYDLNHSVTRLGWAILATMIISIATAFSATILFGEDLMVPGAPG